MRLCASTLGWKPPQFNKSVLFLVVEKVFISPNRNGVFHQASCELRPSHQFLEFVVFVVSAGDKQNNKSRLEKRKGAPLVVVFFSVVFRLF